MLAFVIKYWVQFLFGLIALGITTFLGKFWTMYKAEHTRAQEELMDKFQELSDAGDTKLQVQIDELKTGYKEDTNVLKRGLLSMQGKQFKQDCSLLLEENHVITLDEFKQIDEDHIAYNDLGGNHLGDSLFELVKAKFEKQL